MSTTNTILFCTVSRVLTLTNDVRVQVHGPLDIVGKLRYDYYIAAHELARPFSRKEEEDLINAIVLGIETGETVRTCPWQIL